MRRNLIAGAAKNPLTHFPGGGNYPYAEAAENLRWHL